MAGLNGAAYWPDDFVWKVFEADCLDILPQMPECSVDSMVSDPPGGIGFMGKKWDTFGGRHDFVAKLTPVLRECLRVLKPGAHALVWALPRTSHWTAWAIEDAGFEVREIVLHLFGQGFPKSLNVQRAINKAARGCPQGGPDTESPSHGKFKGGCCEESPDGRGFGAGPGSFMAEQNKGRGDDEGPWNGWGTALKPAAENWILCRKPPEKGLSIAGNILKWGVGAINIDGCRIPGDTGSGSWGSEHEGKSDAFFNHSPDRSTHRTSPVPSPDGEIARWPANVTHDGSEEVMDEFAKFGERKSGLMKAGQVRTKDGGYHGGFPEVATSRGTYGDSGSAARFFYCSKASTADREEGLEDLPVSKRDTPMAGRGQPGLKCRKCDKWKVGGSPCRCPEPDFQPVGFKRRIVKNLHPTVKPTALMRWLCRMITPPNGIVIDPFCGSGSTGKACAIEGFRFVGIEKDPDNCRISRARIEWAVGWADRIRAEETAESEARERQIKLFPEGQGES